MGGLLTFDIAFNTVIWCVLCTGLCPDWQDWNPVNNVDNATEAMDAAEQWLDVPQVHYCFINPITDCIV